RQFAFDPNNRWKNDRSRNRDRRCRQLWPGAISRFEPWRGICLNEFCERHPELFAAQNEQPGRFSIFLSLEIVIGHLQPCLPRKTSVVWKHEKGRVFHEEKT